MGEGGEALTRDMVSRSNFRIHKSDGRTVTRSSLAENQQYCNLILHVQAMRRLCVLNYKGAWQVLEDDAAEQACFAGWKRTLFQIDEALSWESAKHL